MTTIPKVKICGITTPEDGIFAINQGADIVGVVRSDHSPRRGSREVIRQLAKKGIDVAAVYTDFNTVLSECSDEEYVQLHFPHGKEEIDYVKEKLGKRIISVITTADLDGERKRSEELLRYGADIVLLELKLGNWNSVNKTRLNLIGSAIGVAGKISSLNIGEILGINPYIVDLSSSLESAAGVKDHNKIKSFMEVIRLEQVPGK